MTCVPSYRPNLRTGAQAELENAKMGIGNDLMEFHRHLDDELNELRDLVLLLGGEAERAIERAMFALRERDNNVAREVLEHDDEVDRLEVEVDRQCVDVIALRQPAARDLRFVISVAKMAPIL